MGRVVVEGDLVLIQTIHGFRVVEDEGESVQGERERRFSSVLCALSQRRDSRCNCSFALDRRSCTVFGGHDKMFEGVEIFVLLIVCRLCRGLCTCKLRQSRRHRMARGD